MTRICITGGPRTGKTTLADEVGRQQFAARHQEMGSIRHTDSLIGTHDWSSASLEVSRWLDEPGPWIIEGVAVSRALRKWRDAHPGERPPVDRVIYLSHPRERLNAGQLTMAKGVASVHDEIEPWLRVHGIRTEHPMTAHQVPRSSMGGPT